MDEPDTTRILSRDSLARTEDGSPAADDGERPEEKRASAWWRAVTVEPVMFFAMFSLVLQGPLSTQYLFDRMSQEVGFNRSARSECGGNGSLPPDPLHKEVETLTAHWNLYLNLVGFTVGMLMVPLLGSWSDFAGRRVILIIPSVGMALQAAVYLLVMYLELPVAYFLVGRIVSGLSGDFSVVLAGCFSYVADISDRQTRTFRVAILEACLGVSGLLASIVGGQWKQAQGYIKPFWLVLATNLASALYVYLFLRETVQSDPAAKFPAFRHYKVVWRLLSTGGATAGEEGRRFHRIQLWLYLLSIFVVVVVHSGSMSLFVLYELSWPLCWGPTLIGFGSATFHVAYLSSLLGLNLMQRCLADSWVALVGLVSNMVGLVVVSISNSTQLMFTGYGLNCLFMTTTPVIRSKLSKLVDASQQGALFAAVACVESLSFLVGTSLYNALYPVAMHFMKGFPFLFGALLQLIPAGIIGVLQCFELRRDP